MNAILTSLALLVAGAIIKFIFDQVSDYIRGIQPRIEYSSPRSIPVKAEQKVYCAYVLTIHNASRKRAEELNFHLRAYRADLSLDNVNLPKGLEPKTSAGDEGLTISIPYLKRGETAQVKVLAVAEYSLPDRLEISFFSPNDVIAKRTDKEGQQEIRPWRWLIGGAMSGLALIVAGGVIASQVLKPEQLTEANRAIIIASASGASLPQFAELYLTAPEPLYYSEGDLAFSLAQESGKPAEIEKYRRLISLTLRGAEGIVPESQASLYYNRGKLDLLLSDDSGALDDFRRAISVSKSTVEARIKIDEDIQKYLVQHGLL